MAELTIDVDDLATLTMLAEHLGVTRGALGMTEVRWREGGFPAPKIDLGPRVRLWSRKEVEDWYRR